MATYGGGMVQGGNALKNVSFDVYNYNTNFSDASLNTNLGLQFNRVTGPQIITMRYNNGGPIEPSWEFYIKGGSNTTSSNLSPMFQTTATNYGVEDYVPDNFPPKGCTISVLPKPVNSTRINIFEIREFVTGLNLVFRIAMCPSGPVSPILTLPSPQVILFPINLTTTFYRISSGFGIAGLFSTYGAPQYDIDSLKTEFLSSGGINPLDAGNPLSFRRYSGQQTIMVTNISSGFYFSFDINFGIIKQGDGYIGYTSPTINAVLVENSLSKNCIVTNTGIDQASIVKVLEYSVLALDGRTYIFKFDPNPYNQKAPTIKMVGPAFGIESVVVESLYLHFDYV